MLERKVACWGCFDGELHEGHHYFLHECLKYGEQLYVFIVKDEVIVRNKKRTPLRPQIERVKNMQAISGVTLAVALLGDIEHQYNQVLKINPAVYCFGQDQVSDYDFELEKRLLKQGTKVIRIDRLDGFSTTQLYFPTSTK